METKLKFDPSKMVEELILSKISKFDSGLNIKVSSTFERKILNFKTLRCTIEEIKAFHL